MMLNSVQFVLDSLWAGVVESSGLDLLHHTLTFRVKTFKMGREESHVLTFSEVSALYFVNAEGQNRLFPLPAEPGDYVELTSLNYIAEGIGEFHLRAALPEWATADFRSRPNFALEIWSSWLFVEANRVTVDDVTLTVGYPTT